MGSSNEYTPVSEDSILMSTIQSTPEIEPSSALTERATLHASSVSRSCSKEVYYTEYVPYQLGFYNCGLFPEFYFQFKKNFSTEAKENAAYCNLSLQDFKASYEGSKDDIRKSVACVKADFDRKFRQCLDSDLRKDFSERAFTREFVENQFCEKLEYRKDLVSEPLRLAELARQIRTDFRVEPLVEFLNAFGYPELLIWTLLFEVLGLSALDDYRNEKALSAAAGWKYEPGSVARRAQAVADLYKAAAYLEPTVVGKEDMGLFSTILYKFCEACVLLGSTILFENLFLVLLFIFTVACALLFVWFIASLILNLNA